MDANRRIRELFDAAVDLPKVRRLPFLREACGGDERLFAEAARLVSAYEHSVEVDSPAGLVGRIIGAYEILRELGSGGMGAVYLARRIDGTFERQVAFKVVRGDHSTDGALERFARERRLLATLAHPGIARLLDAGSTDDGRPYFVMEYVDGLPVTEFCDRHSLSVRSRLVLFQRVCEAVASAHRVPIVHCDLKPGNILVGAEGLPRVLDFGIATALTPGGLEAEPPLEPYGSPRYASPEQLRGEPVQTTSDVYSLGVVLYELLIGSAPAAAEIEHTPLRPSSLIPGGGETTAVAIHRPELVAARRGTDPGGLRRSVAGDLDAILARCLQPRPEQRYQSVEALSGDLQRHLDGRPVTVRPQTFLYVASRFARRHRWAVASAIVVGVLLGFAFTSLAFLWRRAEQARVQAEQRFNDVRSLATSLFDVDEALSKVAGTTEARQRITESASAYLDRLSEDAQIDSALSVEIAEGYRRVGDMLGNPNVPNLGRRDEALQRYEAAEQRLAVATMARPDDRVAQVTSARIERSKGDVLFAQRRLGEARDAYGRAMAIVQRLLASEPESTEHKQFLSGIYRPLGDVSLARGNAQEALSFYEKSRALDLAVLALHPDASGEPTRLLALTQLRVAEAAAALGRRADAVEAYQEAARLLLSLSLQFPGRAHLLRDLALARMKLGQAADADGDPVGAAELHGALSTFRELASLDPEDAGAQRDLMAGLVAYGDSIAKSDPSAARAYLLEARRLAERLGAEPSRDVTAARDLGVIGTRFTDSDLGGAPKLKIAIIRDGGEVPLGNGSLAPAIGEELRISWQVNEVRSQYLLMLGGQGPPTMLSRDEVAAAGWRVRTNGPMPSQTLLVLDLQDPLSDSARAALFARVNRVAGPRTLASEAHIDWPSGTIEVMDTSFRARGGPPGWVRALREELEGIPGLVYSGRTFPIDTLR